MNDLHDRLLLFDVDGTLLVGGTGYHNDSLRRAVQTVSGVLPDEDISLAGRTDTEIVHDMLASAGMAPTPEAVQRVFELSIADFDERCPLDISEYVIDGVQTALSRLERAGATMGLVTGNIEAIGWRKMKSAGLRRYFGFGAFGDESARRADLPPLAVMRAGRPFSAQASYVIGDTPRDIDCGAACDMKTIAVATGRYSLAELLACGPTLACANLAAFANAILNGEV